MSMERVPMTIEGHKRLEAELVSLEEEADALTARWQAEKQKLGLAADLKKQLDEARNELAIAQRKGEFQRAGELAYGEIPKLEKQLIEAEAQSGFKARRSQDAGRVIDEAQAVQHANAPCLQVKLAAPEIQ